MVKSSLSFQMFVLLSATNLNIIVDARSSLSFTPPSFCNGIECPYFNTTSNETLDGRNVEFRDYPSQYWISEIIIGTDFQSAVDTGFNSCFDYISGENADSTNINMTAPVTVYVTEGGEQSNHTVSFYTPWNNQVWTGEYPPEPTQSDVFVNQLPAMKVAVLGFGGFGDQDVIEAKVLELESSLKSAGIDYDKQHWCVHGYIVCL